MYSTVLLTGSHDTYVFRLVHPLDDTVLTSKLDYPTNLWQAENGEYYYRLCFQTPN